MVENQIYTTLNTGAKMPLLGLGVYDMYNSEAEQAVEWALEIGYRLVDTAAMYENETEIGNAIRNSQVPRSEIFITTKVHDQDQGYDKTMKAFEVSQRKLNCDYINLYLIHWPLKATRKDTWKALEKLYTDGQVKAIGVANYLSPFLKEMEEYSTIIPSVNQVEFSPYLYLSALEKDCKNRNIQLQAYSPLVRGERLSDPKLLNIATKYNKSPAQIILRWILQKGISAIPKSANLVRLKENFDIFDFQINKQDMEIIDTFNENLRVVPDPIVMF